MPLISEARERTDFFPDTSEIMPSCQRAGTTLEMTGGPAAGNDDKCHIMTTVHWYLGIVAHTSQLSFYQDSLLDTCSWRSSNESPVHITRVDQWDAGEDVAINSMSSHGFIINLQQQWHWFSNSLTESIDRNNNMLTKLITWFCIIHKISLCVHVFTLIIDYDLTQQSVYPPCPRCWRSPRDTLGPGTSGQSPGRWWSCWSQQLRTASAPASSGAPGPAQSGGTRKSGSRASQAAAESENQRHVWWDFACLHGHNNSQWWLHVSPRNGMLWFHNDVWH